MLTALISLLLRLVPHSLVVGSTSLVAWVLSFLPLKELRRLRLNVHRVWGLPPHSHFARMFERQCIRHQVMSAVETLKGAAFKIHPLAVSGFDEFCRLAKECEDLGKGVIFATAHVGSWELCAHQIGKAILGKLYVLGKRANIGDLATGFLDQTRRRMGVERVLWTDSKDLIKDMIAVVKAGDSLGIVMDQKPKGRVGPEVEFFGLKTNFVGGPATLALRYGTPIIMHACVREGLFRYRMLCHRIRYEDLTDSPDAVVTLTQRLAHAIEEIVRCYPEQWLWSYKRWTYTEGAS